MASISLAMVQGQKNAQDLARGQISTMADMAKSAQQYDTTMDYFAAPNVAKREADLAEIADYNTKVANLKTNYPDINTNPEAAAARMLSERTGQPMQIIRDNTGAYHARPIVPMPAGEPDMQSPAWQKFYAQTAEAIQKTMPLGAQSPDQLISKSLQDYLYSPTKQAEAAISRAAEQTKIDQEIRKENLKALGQEQAKLLPGGHYATQKDVAGITGAYGLKGKQVEAGATIGAADITGRARVAGERVKNELPMEKLPAFLTPVIEASTGARKDKDGNWTLLGKNEKGESISVPYDQATPEAKDAFNQKTLDVITSTLGGLAKGQGLSGITGEAAPAARAAAEKRAGEMRRQMAGQTTPGISPEPLPSVGGIPVNQAMVDSLVRAGVRPDIAIKEAASRQGLGRRIMGEEVQMGF